MWTPLRILYSLIALVLCTAGYLGYSRALGEYNGLPPLPESFREGASGVDTPTIQGSSQTDRMMELAFGDNCAELSFPIKLYMKQKGLLIAAHEYKIIKSGPREGWVEMSPLSLASLAERKTAAGITEINTIYCDVAYLKFDKPVRVMSDFDGRKIMICELHADPEAYLTDKRKGRIRFRNNRKSLTLDDDIEMVTPGPLYYEAEPARTKPHIYTFTEVQITDHLNSDLPEPDHTASRPPTMAGVGLRVFLTSETKDKAKEKTPKKDVVAKNPKKAAPKSGVTGVESMGLEKNVEMNLWTDANASFIAPGGDAKKEPKKAGDVAAKPKGPFDKRLLQVKTKGPFRYDLTKELAHFEKPAVLTPGLIEHVTVTRSSKTTGTDLLDCDFMDVQFHRKKPEVTEGKKGLLPSPLTKSAKEPSEGDLEVKTIRAWGETVVITSDSDNLHATGSELIHDAEAKMTILRGTTQQPVQAVKERNFLRGTELHMYGNGKEITQAHILGDGSIGIGDIDPKTKEYYKQAFWNDRLVYTREGEKDKLLDVFTFLSKDGSRSMFKDTSSGEVQQIEAQQLKVWLKPGEREKDGKKPIEKKPIEKQSTEKPKKDDGVGSAKPIRLEGIGNVSSLTPDLIVKRADSLNVYFKEVPKLMKEPKAKEPKAKDTKIQPREVPNTPKPPAAKSKDEPKLEIPDVKIPEAKANPEAKKEEPKKKIPFIVVARVIESWVNRDPEGKSEIDRVHAAGDVDAHQAPEAKDKLGNDIAGQTVDIQNYPDGYRMVVIGDPSDMNNPKWGVVRADKLTTFGFDVTIDQRTDTSFVKGEGSLEILSTSDMEGKKLDAPTVMRIFWKHRMDFLGADKLIYFHGDVQAYQESTRLKCEWMQVLLDKPVHLDPERREKAKKPAKPGAKDEDDSAKIDTVMCFHLPKDDDAPRPKTIRPVVAVEEVYEKLESAPDKKGKLLKFQSIQAPELVMINTPAENKKQRHDIHATSSPTLPGTVRIWQAGQKEVENAGGKEKEKKKDPMPKKQLPPRKKGDLAEDEEMKLTIVQFGEKMKAEDLRKWAKFWTNVRVVHLPADSPTVAVDLREGEIPKGAIYMEARDTLEVFNKNQTEVKDGKEVDVPYQEMIAVGNVRVKKQGEFFGDADRVTYSELKGTVTFHGTDKNPAVVNQIRGQGVPHKSMSGRTVTYFLKDKTMQNTGGVGIRD